LAKIQQKNQNETVAECGEMQLFYLRRMKIEN